MSRLPQWRTRLLGKCILTYKHDPLYALAYKVLHSKPIEDHELVGLIRRSWGWRKKLENLTAGDVEVTFSQLAALARNSDFKRQLIKHGVYSDACGSVGLNPDHIAALQGDADFVHPLLKTEGGFSAVDIFETIYPDRSHLLGKWSTRPQTLPFMLADRSVVQVPLEEIERRYGFTYTNRVVVNACMVEERLFAKKPYRYRGPSFHPSLAIVTIKDLFPDLSFDPGLGIVATKAIPAGEDLGPYAGLLRSAEGPGSLYVLGSDLPYTVAGAKPGKAVIDGKDYRNFIPMMADGPPNSETFQHQECNWTSNIRTLRPIRAGELILWDYGPSHPVNRCGPYYQFAPQDMEKIRALLPELMDLIAYHMSYPKPPLKSLRRLHWRWAYYVLNHPRIFLEELLHDRIQPAHLKYLPLNEKDPRSRYYEEMIASAQIALSPEKRRALWAHLQQVGSEDFQEATKFFRTLRVAEFTAAL